MSRAQKTPNGCARARVLVAAELPPASMRSPTNMEGVSKNDNSHNKHIPYVWGQLLFPQWPTLEKQTIHIKRINKGSNRIQPNMWFSATDHSQMPSKLAVAKPWIQPFGHGLLERNFICSGPVLNEGRGLGWRGGSWRSGRARPSQLRRPLDC